MAADLLARGLAATARDGALPALARFADLPSRTVPPTAERIEAWVGGHRGSYVADTLATATLAAAHPRFCKRDAAGRHFRLDQPAITVEQGGATGVAGTNDQPAWQATLDYAAAVGIRTVQATRPAYELWCPQRQQPGLELTDDGHLLVVRSDVTLEGVGPRPKLTRMGYGGAAPTSYQTVPVSGNYWRGGGLYWSHDGGIGAKTRIVVRNLEFDGGCPRTTETSPIYPPGSPNG